MPNIAIGVGLCLLSYIVHQLFFDRLRSIPGPFICRLTSLWTHYHAFVGDESSQINRLHQIYGPIVRIGPNEVVVQDGAALAPIYSEKNGFLKAPCYSNFHSEGVETIFSTQDPAYRKIRSKAVTPLFSTSNIRNGGSKLDECIVEFIQRLQNEAERSKDSQSVVGRPQHVDVLNLSRRVALDTVSAYLFNRSYDGIHEQNEGLSASSYIDSIVDVGRFFFLPNWLFVKVFGASEYMFPNKDAARSFDRVNKFVCDLVTDSSDENDTFQGRLLKVGISDHETNVQMKDLIFAGTDTTGMNLATIIWNLAKQPKIYARLCEEVKTADQEDPSYHPSSLPYLDAVIREGLRLSKANPTRFPRIVPSAGFHFTARDGTSYRVPPGTLIGMQPFTLHFNPEVFVDPTMFRPERWLESPSPEMLRDWFPFGLGPRQCIARNLAMEELYLIVRALARSNVLAGAKHGGESIEVLEWFNSRVRGGKIEVYWEN